MMLAPAAAVPTACGDSVTDPDGLLESAEAEAVMRSAEALPLLPQFLDAHAGLEGGDRTSLLLVRARELWEAGVTTGDSRGADQRRLAIDHAAPALMEVVPAHEWVEAREQLGAWITTARGMLRHVSLPAVEAQIGAAGQQLQRADAAPTDSSRIHHLLLAGSDLVETTPRHVARSMTGEADVAVQRASGATDSRLPRNTVERAQRLKDWAAQAVEEGDYLLAIQRAYYAIQLVEEP